MIHQSPLPHGHHPRPTPDDLPVRERSPARGQGRVRRGGVGPDGHLRGAARFRAAVRRRSHRDGVRSGAGAGDHGAEPAGVRGVVPRRGDDRRNRHDHQSDLHRERGPPSADRRRGDHHGDRPDVPRHRARGREGHEGRDDLRLRRLRRGRRRQPHEARRGAHGRAAHRARAGGPRRHRRPALLIGHDRPVQRRHAHAPEPRRQHRADGWARGAP